MPRIALFISILFLSISGFAQDSTKLNFTIGPRFGMAFHTTPFLESSIGNDNVEHYHRGDQSDPIGEIGLFFSYDITNKHGLTLMYTSNNYNGRDFNSWQTSSDTGNGGLVLASTDVFFRNWYLDYSYHINRNCFDILFKLGIGLHNIRFKGDGAYYTYDADGNTNHVYTGQGQERMRFYGVKPEINAYYCLSPKTQLGLYLAYDHYFGNPVRVNMGYEWTIQELAQLDDFSITFNPVRSISCGLQLRVRI